MPKATHGINPVTIQGDDQYGRTLGLTLSRIWIGEGDKITRKPMCAIISVLDKNDPEKVELLAEFKCEEETMVGGLYHLFPKGELDHAGEAPPTVNQELFNMLRDVLEQAQRAVDGYTYDPYLLDRAAALVKRYE